MEINLEKNITSPQVVARGYAILDEMPWTIEGAKNSSLVPDERKSVTKFVLNYIRENPELVFDSKYASKIVDLTKKTGNYHALNARYKEVLMDKFKIGRKTKEKEFVPGKRYYEVDFEELEKTAQEIKEGYGDFKLKVIGMDNAGNQAEKEIAFSVKDTMEEMK